MGIVTVLCPDTGKEVPTGLVMEPDVFALAKFGPRAFVCDACGEAHVWEKQDGTVHLDGAPVPFPPGEK